MQAAEQISNLDKREVVLEKIIATDITHENRDCKIIKLLNCQLMVAEGNCEVDKVRLILKIYLSEHNGHPLFYRSLWAMGRSTQKFHLIKKFLQELEGKNIETQKLLSKLNEDLQGLALVKGQHLYACLTKISNITKFKLNKNARGNIVGFKGISINPSAEIFRPLHV